MDLYSAARRLTRPFLFTEDVDRARLPIAAHGLIGDGFTAALVRADGAIDWLCLPRFDSPSVFAAILDGERGGITSITPASPRFESLQRYDPDTNVLETLFRVDGQGIARLIDYMPWSNDPRATIHEVHRRIDGIEGTVELDVIFDPRFGYGRHATEIELMEHGVLAKGEQGERLVAVLSDRAKWTPGENGVSARVKLRAGERRWMVLAWDSSRPEPIAAYRPFEHLRNTRKSWREWSRQLRYEGPWRHHVLRSALALKLMIYAPTGAMVAAPTTSLPEYLGGKRNWDYRYTWTRDSAMAVRATNLIGYSHEARDFFHFMRDALEKDQSLQPMYQIDGGHVPEECELTHLRGYYDSGPVRIGNGARDQLQLDTSGALLDAAYHYEWFGGRLPLDTWRALRVVADTAARRWVEPDHGIWEPRSGVRHHVHSKLMCWLALHRGQQIARHFGDKASEAAWSAEANRIRDDILARAISPSGKHFVSIYEGQDADATLLLLPVTGCFRADQPEIAQTIDWVRAELGEGPYLHRYRWDMDDGVGGREGAFILCGFWLAEALTLANRLDEAQEVFTAHAEASNHLGLLAEEIDPRSGIQLGNFPQAFSHLGLINAALRLDLALRLYDEDIAAHPHLVEPIPFAR